VKKGKVDKLDKVGKLCNTLGIVKSSVDSKINKVVIIVKLIISFIVQV
jgi:hypothetical protein